MAKRDKPKDLDKVSKFILKALKNNDNIRLGDFVNKLTQTSDIKDYEIARIVHRLRELNLIELVDPDPPESLLIFLLSSRSAWFWLLTLTVSLTLLAVYLSPIIPIFTYARYVLGSLFVLYLPGATLIELLYPRREDLSQLERLALSIGLSLALVPLVGLILNYTPWGIRLNPIITSLTILTLSLSLGAVARKHSYHLLTFKEEEKK